MTSTLFALVLTVSTTHGGYQDLVLGVYDSKHQCQAAAREQNVHANCYPVERIVPRGEVPAASTVENQEP